MKISLRLKLISIGILILIGFNFMTSYTLWLTEISWIHFFLLNIILAIPYYFFFYFIVLKESKQEKERLSKQLQYLEQPSLYSKRTKVYMALTLGYIFYMLSFSSLPFAYNYYFANGKEVSYVSRKFGLQDEDYYSADDAVTRPQHTYSKIYFFHNGVYFSKNIPQNNGSNGLYYTMKKGALGFNILTECNFYEPK